MNREKAIKLLDTYIKNERMKNHCYASEAVLRALAEQLGYDPDQWGIAGLLHDIDVEITDADPKRHGLEGLPILEEAGMDAESIEAIKLHNEMATDIPRSTDFHHALAAGETITGLIVATTLVYPDKKLASVKPKSVVKRMKQKAFAASVNRDTIRECEKIGIPLPEFAELAIEAMKPISDRLGL
ncbi:MAG: HDIG domain-containing metalloprotein [Bacteroidales bacterium]|nr:HDIG domain-containing metalloprotein [Bacteroidales bacterium]